MPADPKTSAGARLERKVFREYLRRRLRTTTRVDQLLLRLEVQAILNWVLAREKRYDKRPGGLGK